MKKQLIILCLMLGISSVQAQEKGHNIYFNAGAGMHNFKYELANGSVEKNPGYTFNLGYNYYFSDNWGIGTGIGIQSFLAEAKLNYMTETPAIDTDGESYVYRIYYNDWTEKQKVLLFDIPIGISYKTKLNDKWKLQAAVGGKISLPLHSEYEITDGEIETRGYYPQYNVELFDMPQHNFTTINTVPSGSFSVNPIYSTFVDIGTLYNFGKDFDLYVGAYFNYALNNSINVKTNLLYQEDGTYSGVLESNQTDKLQAISIGLKVGVSLPYKALKTIFAKKAPLVEPAPVIIEMPIIIEEKAIVMEAPPIVIEEKAIVMEKSLPFNAAIVEAKKVTAVTDIKFNFNSEKVIGDPMLDELKSLSEILIANPAMKLRIIGHTCDISSHKVNMKIGLQRANAVKEMLLKYDVAESKLLTESMAFDQPLVPNTSEENRAKNRRVQLVVE